MNKAFLIGGILLISATINAQTKTITGFTTQGAAQQFLLEQNFDKNLSSSGIGNTIKELSSRPHNLGSAGSKWVAENIYNRYKSYGFDVRIDTYHVLFPTPKIRVLEMTSPSTYKALLKEPALKEDATSGQADQLPTYNAFSADGDVTAELVFVNYGLPEDYELLERMGIDVKGKIVIAKYGRSWRGIKPKVAQEHGALGCIIYSDPMDDGYFQGDVYPKGAFKNEYGVQRGSVMDMPVYPGDPLTPGVGATANAQRIASHNDATNLLKIPVLPISYHDAEPLLKALDGAVAPDGWRGVLPFTYHIGAGKTKVHLKLEFNWDIVPCYDVIATIKGSLYPDEWIIRGNHHDAWVNGADDPISGQAALLEEAKSIGELLKTGWRPKRTIVYCAWDGEEPALLGSTEFAEDHAKELQEKAVLYINSDANGRGFLGAGGSHALETFMTEVARDVNDPQTNVSVLERLRAQQIINASSAKAKQDAMQKTGIDLNALGSGSDFSSFLQHLGVPSLDIGYGGENNGGDYHSIYDSYDDYRRFKDPSFAYGVALSTTAGHAALRMANAEVLPFDFRNLYKIINGYTEELINLTNDMRDNTKTENDIIRNNYYSVATDTALHLSMPKPKGEVPYLDFSSLQNALLGLQIATDNLWNKWNTMAGAPTTADAFNRKLYQAEQQLLLTNGLPQRGWYRHAIYAPGLYTGYGVKTMPGIREAIEQRDWKQAQQQILLDAEVINNLSNYLKESAQ
ncbi:M28 family peptidase [Panacibacter ginsenosidivorans]|uniref:M28 family peptidase n=1 Tax=Panacibacter ginsenosidivorans TaxID=1813871 RepID=A0A5B8V4Q8_9BACT|nr:transferrin receptor-like dimerization domain-containing protein [Panacibacter ginsenosidivorans]QEC66370.1 M28 family peptidase [Panacibacter ginsenosidivorans]